VIHLNNRQVNVNVNATIRYDTRCYFNVRSKADISQLNLVTLFFLSALALLSACILAVFFFFMLFVHSCTYIT